MDFDTLKTYLTTARMGSFSRAAETLHLTQPAVSKRIQALEQALGRPLFDRVGRRVRLTEAGEVFLPRARRILDELEDGLRTVANLQGQVAGRLSLAASHHIALHRLAPALRTYAARYPEVELELHFMDSEQACQRVAEGELELAMVTLPGESADSVLQEQRLWSDPLEIVAAHDHPLGRHFAPERLADYPALLPPEGTTTRRLIFAALHPLGVEPREGIAPGYLETLKMLIASGLGWGVLPRTMSQGDPRLTPLSIPGITLERSLGAVLHRRRTLSNAAAKMIELCDEVNPTE